MAARHIVRGHKTHGEAEGGRRPNSHTEGGWQHATRRGRTGSTSKQLHRGWVGGGGWQHATEREGTRHTARPNRAHVQTATQRVGGWGGGGWQHTTEREGTSHTGRPKRADVQTATQGWQHTTENVKSAHHTTAPKQGCRFYKVTGS